jgi:hypothetical protein
LEVKNVTLTKPDIQRWSEKNGLRAEFHGAEILGQRVQRFCSMADGANDETAVRRALAQWIGHRAGKVAR